MSVEVDTWRERLYICWVLYFDLVVWPWPNSCWYNSSVWKISAHCINFYQIIYNKDRQELNSLAPVRNENVTKRVTQWIRKASRQAQSLQYSAFCLILFFILICSPVVLSRLTDNFEILDVVLLLLPSPYIHQITFLNCYLFPNYIKTFYSFVTVVSCFTDS